MARLPCYLLPLNAALAPLHPCAYLTLLPAACLAILRGLMAYSDEAPWWLFTADAEEGLGFIKKGGRG